MRVEQVFITPLVSEGVYGDEIEVSDYVKLDGLSKVKNSIDSTDYSIGIFRFDDVTLKCQNGQGTFNENDSRSIFTYVRDRAKVKIQALKIDSETFVSEEKIQFEGLINDEMTRLNITNDEITLKVYSKDSVFRTTRVPAGIIPAGSTAKTALISILSQPAIGVVLNLDPADINPELDFIIDTPEALDNLEVKEALDLILIASSSVLILEDDDIIVRSRNRDTGTPLELRGRGEISNNANLISLKNYNNGKQRQFNSIYLNDGAAVIEDTNSILESGVRQIKFDFPMIADSGTLQDVGQSIADEFRYPKIEVMAEVPAVVAEDVKLLDLVSVDAPFLKKPAEGDFLPVYGVATYGDAVTPYPLTFGSIEITSNIKFKVISIEKDLKNFRTALKLRQFGKNLNDGVFT